MTRHPTVPLALRAALAAVAAWLLVLPLGGVADDYPYYAPLGAVVSVATTVTSSLRTAVQTFLALVGGTLLGLAGMAPGVPALLALGVVVALGTLVSTWSRLGAMGSWVPISALFVLILGRDDPSHFVLAYLGLTTLGAVVGAGVNAALPPLHLSSTVRAQLQLRESLVDQLEQLAEGLEAEPLPSYDDWDGRRLDMEPRAQRVRELVAEATREPPVNWRARRWRDRVERLHAQGRALVNLAFLVGDLTEFLAGRERYEASEVPLGPSLRPAAAHALHAAADALRSVEDSVAGTEEIRAALDATHDLAAAVRDERRQSGGDLYAAGSLVVGIERALLTVAPTTDDTGLNPPVR